MLMRLYGKLFEGIGWLVLIGITLALLFFLAIVLGTDTARADESNGYEKPDFGEVCDKFLKNCPQEGSNREDDDQELVQLDLFLPDNTKRQHIVGGIQTNVNGVGFNGMFAHKLTDNSVIGLGGAVSTKGDFLIGVRGGISLDLF